MTQYEGARKYANKVIDIVGWLRHGNDIDTATAMVATWVLQVRKDAKASHNTATQAVEDVLFEKLFRYVWKGYRFDGTRER